MFIINKMVSPRIYKQLNFIQNNLALFVTALCIIVVERFIKYYIVEMLSLGESIPVIGETFMITRSQNLGAAFGIFQGFGWIFVAASIGVIIIFIVFYNRIIKDTWLIFASAFILGGSVGNMMDRLFFGHVIDYIYFSFWPTFNISDAALSIGTLILAIKIYYWEKEHKPKISSKAMEEF